MARHQGRQRARAARRARGPALGRTRARARGAREEIDALNVYPVPDGDTGTNLYLTVEAAPRRRARAPRARRRRSRDLARDARCARGALLGARGNSGVILSQLLRGLGDASAGGDRPAVSTPRPGRGAAAGRRRGHARASARPVEGTILTVAAGRRRRRRGRAATARAPPATWSPRPPTAARTALARDARAARGARARPGSWTPAAAGCVVVLDALSDDVLDAARRPPAAATAARSAAHGPRPPPAPARGPDAAGPAYEVMYLLDADDDARRRRCARRWTALGDSLVVVGGDGLWNVHVHVDDVGAALEAGHRGRTPAPDPGDPLRRADAAAPAAAGHAGGGRGRRVAGAGAGGRCSRTAGATVVHGGPGPPRLDRADPRRRSARCTRREVIVLPNDSDTLRAAEAAARTAADEGSEVARRARPGRGAGRSPRWPSTTPPATFDDDLRRR